VLSFFIALHRGERLGLQSAPANSSDHIGVVLNGMHHTKTIRDKVGSSQTNKSVRKQWPMTNA
jgi:hypothetical protein